MKIFRILFPKPEVKLVQNEIDNYTYLFEKEITFFGFGYFRLLKEIQNKAKKLATNSDDVVECINEHNMHPKQVALTIIAKVAVLLLETGDYGNPFGMLSEDGRDLMRIASYAVSKLNELGYISEYELRQFSNELIQFTIPAWLQGEF